MVKRERDGGEGAKWGGGVGGARRAKDGAKQGGVDGCTRGSKDLWLDDRRCPQTPQAVQAEVDVLLGLLGLAVGVHPPLCVGSLHPSTILTTMTTMTTSTLRIMLQQQ